MGFRICMMSILVTAFTSAFAAAPQSHSQLQPSLPALAVQAPPVAQPPRVPGEPPRSPVPQLPTGSRPESPRNDQITVTGCVEQSGGQASTKEPAAATGTSGKAAGTSKMSKYILTNPKLLGAVTGSPNGQTSSSSSASGGLYQLDARDGKLSPHVGHQVEVIG